MGNVLFLTLLATLGIPVLQASRCTITVGISSYHSSPCSPAQPLCTWALDLVSITKDQLLYPPCQNLITYSNYHKTYSLYLFPHWVQKPLRRGLGYYSASYSDPCSLQCPYLGSQSWTCPYTGPVSSPTWRFSTDVNFTQEVSRVSLKLHFSKCGSSLTLLIDAPGYDPLWYLTSEPTQEPPTPPPLVSDSDLEHVLTPSASWASKMLTLIHLTLQSTNYSCMVCIDRASLSSWHVLYTPNISSNAPSKPIVRPSLALSAPRPQPFPWTHCYQPQVQAVTTAKCNNSIILPPFSLSPLPGAPLTRRRRAVPVAVWLVSALAAGTGIAGGVTGSLSLASSRSLLSEVDKDISHLTRAIVKNHQNILRVAQYAAQNRRGLDLLFWEQGGLCKAIQEQCCFLNISNTHISVLQERPPLETRVTTGWGLNWDLGLSQWAREALQTGITLLALLLLIIILGPCIIRQLQALPQRLQQRPDQYPLLNPETPL
ncbi:envelope glycoprotein [Human T-lymphotropic virus 4]|uniref:Env polyprotein n=1 Tax=Human T-lymphotropic virus 4 TaxID=318279 RepID=B8LHM3_9DELA|nr:envelope glycoprotein [Human T-lymphotropic virus 4]ABR68002.1 envelope glycoprotein [Human T-lymphotropic virus 4]